MITQKMNILDFECGFLKTKCVCWVILTMVYSKSFSIEMDAVSEKSGY